MLRSKEECKHPERTCKWCFECDNDVEPVNTDDATELDIPVSEEGC